LVTAPAALPPESRPALSSSRGGSRDRAAYGSYYPFLRCPGFQAACQVGCGPAAALGPPGSRAVDAAGDQVLLAALPDQDSLAAYPLAVVDQAIRAHGSFQHVQGGRP
jgi:hypothetical protein